MPSAAISAAQAYPAATIVVSETFCRAIGVI